MHWILAIVFAAVACANDGSGESTPAGGVQLRREARISMEKERLTIGLHKVTVEYEFLNTSSTDITTEVLFPLTPYGFETLVSHVYGEPVENFHVWVDGKAVRYETQTEAVVNGVDYAPRLKKLGVDFLEFGHFDSQPEIKEKTDLERLSPTDRAELIRLGIYDEDDIPRWKVSKTYHWRQTFPAKRVMHIRHEYEPATGMDHWDVRGGLQGKNRVARPKDFCIDPPLLKTLEKALANNNGYYDGNVEPTWVDYILTTANTWKTPIKDFILVVERPKPMGSERWYVSLCWPGKLEARGADTFVAHEKDFVPKKELRVMFVQVGK